MVASSLLEAFTDIADPRRAASIVYPLARLLALAVTALLANRRSALAIAEWAARQSDVVLAPLGLRRGQTPCRSTPEWLFARLDGQTVAVALSHALAVPRPSAARGSAGVAIDGKAQRGRLRYQPSGCPAHALNAVLHDRGIVLAQAPIMAGGDKAAANGRVDHRPPPRASRGWTGLGGC